MPNTSLSSLGAAGCDIYSRLLPGHGCDRTRGLRLPPGGRTFVIDTSGPIVMEARYDLVEEI